MKLKMTGNNCGKLDFCTRECRKDIIICKPNANIIVILE